MSDKKEIFVDKSIEDQYKMLTDGGYIGFLSVSPFHEGGEPFEGLIDSMEDAWAYTFGLHRTDRPEIIAFCGPCADEDPFDKEKTQAVLHDLSASIMAVVADWYTETPRHNREFLTSIGRMYRISIPTPEEAKRLRDDFLSAASVDRLYDNYDLMVIRPLSYIDFNTEVPSITQ